MKTIITSGKVYADIDVLACAMAYRDYLDAKNVLADVVIESNLNGTVSDTIKNWQLSFKLKLEKNEDQHNFIIVDCANPSILPEFVEFKKVIEVYDHHFIDDIKLWNGSGAKVLIELVGACATLIWEKIKEENLEDKISETSLKLLYTAIFANTLNFKSSVTTNRDLTAFSDIQSRVSLDKNYIASYYEEVESAMFSDPISSIKSDTKIVDILKNELKLVIGQIELWNSKEFVYKNMQKIEKALSSFGYENWFLTSPSISEGRNYIFTKSEAVKNILRDNLDIKFDGDLGVTNKLWLRKEILRKFN